MEWSYLTLGLVQGATEFLPVSSSGHLLLFEHVLNPDLDANSSLFLNVMLHMGTLLAVVLFFRGFLLTYLREAVAWIKNPQVKLNETQREILWIIVLSLPTALIGLGLKKLGIGEMKSEGVLIALAITGLFCIFTDFLPIRDQKLNFWRSLLLGITQGLAVVPGISRSGSTIFVGILSGISREKMASFSFLMSIPAVGGAFLLEMWGAKGIELRAINSISLIAGMAVAFVSGYLALTVLMRVLKSRYFRIFGFYCFGLSVFGNSIIEWAGSHLG